MKSNKGFSLVELIVVIAIMAIIAAVAVPAYSAYVTKANEGVDENVYNEAVYAAKIAVVETDYNAVTITVSAADGKLTISATGTNGADAAKQVADVVGATLGDNGTYELTLKSTTFEDSATVKGVSVN